MVNVKDGEIEYVIEDLLAKKLDYGVKSITRDKLEQDAFIANHGRTGSGKTNSSLVEAHYVRWKTGRDIHMFFRLPSLLEFAKTTEKKIIIWDEPSLDSLSLDQVTVLGKNLVRLVNTVREKRHFFIINFTKFWKFPEHLVSERLNSLIHMYNEGGKDAGRFLYIPENRLERLYRAKKQQGIILIGKLKTFGGRMPEIMKKYMDKMCITIEGQQNCTLNDYKRLKAEAIDGIGTFEKRSKTEIRLVDQNEKLKAILEKMKDELLKIKKESQIQSSNLTHKSPKNDSKSEVLLGESDF